MRRLSVLVCLCLAGLGCRSSRPEVPDPSFITQDSKTFFAPPRVPATAAEAARSPEAISWSQAEPAEAPEADGKAEK